MKKSIRFCVCLFLIYSSISAIPPANQIPKLTVVVVIDQFAYFYITKLKKYFKYGFKDFLENGIVYENAYHPHGIPETATGHNAISTGTMPAYHGIISNAWLMSDGEKIKYPNDPSKDAFVFGREKKKRGKSNKLTLVDGISDQFKFAGNVDEKHLVFSISLKDRAAIGMANKTGKAIWFDCQQGCFSSSKKYFRKLPRWVTKFNDKKVKNIKKLTWKSFYDESGPEYNFPFIKNYDYASFDFRLATSKPIEIDLLKPMPLNLFLKMPHSSQCLFDLSKDCLDTNFDADSNDKMLLWISLSNFDLVGHFYGPDSFEMTDLVYHLDKQIKDFTEIVYKKYGQENVLFVLTADHGVQPIQELEYKKGNTLAKRILAKPLIKEMNDLVSKKFNVEKIVKMFDASFFYLNPLKLKKLNFEKKKEILLLLKNYLLSIPGIKNVWTRWELSHKVFKPNSIESFYKNHVGSNRLGDLICQPQPYCLITNYDKGCSHNTGYEYDTHVPLVIYQKGKYENKKITQKVWIPQLAPTMSKMLGCGRPVTSMFPTLPGIV
jgi:predicted AlkP superfamily pyrophosphatase or phosphodiesterase